MTNFKVNMSLPCVVLLRHYAKEVIDPIGFVFLAKTIIKFCKRHGIELFERIDGMPVDIRVIEQDTDLILGFTSDLFSGIESYDVFLNNPDNRVIGLDDEGVDSCRALVVRLLAFNLPRELTMLTLVDNRAALLAKTNMPVYLTATLKSLADFNEST